MSITGELIWPFVVLPSPIDPLRSQILILEIQRKDQQSPMNDVLTPILAVVGLVALILCKIDPNGTVTFVESLQLNIS